VQIALVVVAPLNPLKQTKQYGRRVAMDRQKISLYIFICRSKADDQLGTGFPYVQILEEC
jgi:hypothetical protein